MGEFSKASLKFFYNYERLSSLLVFFDEATLRVVGGILHLVDLKILEVKRSFLYLTMTFFVAEFI
jgi:hypothetical protein